MKTKFEREYTLERAQDERKKLLAECKALVSTVEREGRDWSPGEKLIYDEKMQDIDDLQEVITTMQARGEQPRILTGNIREQNGKEIRVYNPGDNIHKPDFSVGKVALAMLRPEMRRELNDNETRALVTGQDSSGGVLVPEDMNDAVVAPLRARAVITRNMRTITMPQLNSTLLGIDTDATAAAAAEGAALSEADITFMGIFLKGHKIGAYVKVSEELLMASNAAALIEDSLLYAVARKLDSYAIHGVGGVEPEGLENISGIYSNLAIGALSFGTISTEIHDLIGNDVEEPYQCFYATNVAGYLDAVQDATTKAYVSDDKLPQSWARMQRRSSGILNDGYMVFGAFNQYGYVAMGNGWRIETSKSASDSTTDAFPQGMVFVRILGWADIAFAQPGAFQVLTGITSVTDLA